MPYTLDEIEQILNEMGEIVVVLESGQEYELHIHDTSFNNDEVSSQGMLDGEYTIVSFKPERVEQVKVHEVL